MIGQLKLTAPRSMSLYLYLTLIGEETIGFKSIIFIKEIRVLTISVITD